MVNNVETLMYVLIEFIFCLGIPKTPTREAPEEMDHAIFHSHIRIIKTIVDSIIYCNGVRAWVCVCVCVC